MLKPVTITPVVYARSDETTVKIMIRQLVIWSKAITHAIIPLY